MANLQLNFPAVNQHETRPNKSSFTLLGGAEHDVNTTSPHFHSRAFIVWYPMLAAERTDTKPAGMNLPVFSSLCPIPRVISAEVLAAREFPPNCKSPLLDIIIPLATRRPPP